MQVPMLACTGNHEIEAESDATDTTFKSVQARWKVSTQALIQHNLLPHAWPHSAVKTVRSILTHIILVHGVENMICKSHACLWKPTHCAFISVRMAHCLHTIRMQVFASAQAIVLHYM